jgi:hypothetical protein
MSDLLSGLWYTFAPLVPLALMVTAVLLLMVAL